MKKSVFTGLLMSACILICADTFLSGCTGTLQTDSNNQWTQLGASSTSSLKGNITSLTVDPSGNIYVAGELYVNGTSTYIAKLNITTSVWSAIGPSSTNEFNSGVRAPVVSDNSGNIYAHGMAEGQGVNLHYVAKLNQSNNTWSILGEGVHPIFNNGIYSIITDAPGHVYISGCYIELPGVQFIKYYHAKFVDNTWFELEGEFNPEKMIVDSEGSLYASGGFNHTFGSGLCVAKWVINSWEEVGGDYSSLFNSGWVNSMAFDSGGNLYVAGQFMSKTAEISTLYKWTKSTNTWSKINDDKFSEIYSIVFDKSNNLLACGEQYQSSSTNYVYKLTNNGWDDYGNLKAKGTINVLFKSNSGKIYAAGGFKNSNNNLYVAKIE